MKAELIKMAEKKLEAYKKTGLKGFEQQALDYLRAADLKPFEIAEILAK